MELYDRRTAPMRADTWFVYALVDSRFPNEIRYVGITNNPKSRLSHHLSQAPKEGWKKSRWIGSVIEAGGNVLMGMVAAGLSQDDAMALEVRLIAEHRASGARLMNLTDGGDGVKGQVQSAETRAKKSAALKGMTKSPESIAMRAEMLRGRKATDETRAAMSAAHLKRYQSDPDAVDRQRQITKKRFEDPRERARISQLLLDRFSDPVEREKISASLRKRFEDPAERQKLADASRQRGPQSNNKLGFKGVFFEKRRGKFIARMKLSGKNMHLGYHDSPAAAARAYDKAAHSAWGADCYLNFPNEVTA